MDRRKFLGGAVAGSAALASSVPAEQRGEIKSAQYVIVELLGYKRLCGRLTQAPAGLLQLDVPVEGGFVTQWINPSSIYRVTICDEPTVKEIAKTVDPFQRMLDDFFDEDDWHR